MNNVIYKNLLMVVGVMALGACSDSDNDSVMGAGSGGGNTVECPTASELEPVQCPSVISMDTVLDGQIMSCASGLDINGATLELYGGSQLRLAASDEVDVVNGGAIVSIGTPDCPNTITSSTSSPWEFISIRPGDQTPSQFTHTIIENAASTSIGTYALLATAGVPIGFDNVTLRRFGNNGLFLRDANVTQFRGVTFSDINGQTSALFQPDDVAVIEAPINMAAGTVTSPYLDIEGSLSVTSLWEEVGASYRVPTNGPMLIDGASLTISEGVSLLFAPGAGGIVVTRGGTLRIAGTMNEPVLLASSASNPQPGDWAQIQLLSDAASDSFFNYMIVQHAGEQGFGGLDLYESVSMSNSTFLNNRDCDVTRHGTDIVISPDNNNTYTEC